MSGGIFIVISAFFIDMRKIFQKYYLFIYWAISVGLIGISYLLSFTRTVWIGAFMASFVLFFLLHRERRNFLYKVGYTLALLTIIIVVYKMANSFLFPDIDLAQPIEERAEFMWYEDTFEEAYQTRETGMKTELNLWQNGTIIWGVGACYPPSLLGADMKEEGALNHEAFSTYLAHFGLIGFITYGLLLPFFTIRIARRYYLTHNLDYGGIIAVTAMALALFDVFTLLSSNQYLISTSQVQGLIYGALWGLSRSLEGYMTRNSGNQIMFHQPQHQWLPGPVK
jgi:hypothetical protein